MLGSRRVSRDVGQVDLGLLRGRKLDLCLFGGLLQTLQGENVLAQVDALLLLELVGHVVHEALIEVFAAQECIAVGREHLELMLAFDRRDLDDRDIEGAAAEIVHGDLAVPLLLVHTESELPPRWAH